MILRNPRKAKSSCNNGFVGNQIGRLRDTFPFSFLSTTSSSTTPDPDTDTSVDVNSLPIISAINGNVVRATGELAEPGAIHIAIYADGAAQPNPSDLVSGAGAIAFNNAILVPNTSNNVDLEGLADGNYEVAAVLRDNAGNFSAITFQSVTISNLAAITFTIDATGGVTTSPVIATSPSNSTNWSFSDATPDVIGDDKLSQALSGGIVEVTGTAVGGDPISIAAVSDFVTTFSVDASNDAAWASLTSIRFSSMPQFTSCPAGVQYWKSLVSARLFLSGLTALPPEIGNWTSVTLLQIDRNSLASLPTEIGLLTSLTIFLANGNALTDISPILTTGFLDGLTQLRLDANSLPITQLIALIDFFNDNAGIAGIGDVRINGAGNASIVGVDSASNPGTLLTDIIATNLVPRGFNIQAN